MDVDTDWTFVETAYFTRRVQEMGLDEELRELQLALLKNPQAGSLDPATGGLRKTRMADPARGKGKSGGARVHYLVVNRRRTIYLIFIYGKDEQSTLSQRQKDQLRTVVTAILKG